MERDQYEKPWGRRPLKRPHQTVVARQKALLDLQLRWSRERPGVDTDDDPEFLAAAAAIEESFRD